MNDLKEKQWIADLGDGTYRNPILYTDYSDPDAIRVGDDYFMTASSFCNAPGLPILHSKDLVNWELINYAIKQIPEDIYEKPIHGCGVWAPAIRFHEGVYYIFFPMPDEGIYVTHTTDPWGAWSEPHCLHSVSGWIDPCPFWDDDGRCYMVSAYAKSRIGFKSILRLTELTPDCTRIIDMGKDIFDGNVEHQETIEGPKLYKRNGYYYIFAPSGGVKQGWQTVLRSRNIWGPYEYKNVLMQKDTPVNGPHQGAWVDTQTGEDWFIHFQDVYAAGRITHLQPMKWLDNDWPVIGAYEEGEESGKPVLVHKKPNVGAEHEVVCPPSSDEFDDKELGLQWQWNANWKKEWYELMPEKSSIRLLAAEKQPETSISNTSNLLLQKWSMPEFTSTVKMDVSGLKEGDIAGIVSLGEDYAALSVACEEGGKKLYVLHGTQSYSGQVCYATDEKESVAVLEGNEVFFKIEVKRIPSIAVNQDGPYTFPIPREEVVLYYSADGETYEAAYRYVAKAGRWVGVKTGVFCCHEGAGESGYADIDYVHMKGVYSL